MSAMMTALRELGIDVTITTMPYEIADCIPFEQDTLHAAYDADYANRFWRVLLAANEVMAHFRTAFLGKSSPVHFFWGSFDLAVTRFSGRDRAAPSRRRADICRMRSRRRPIRTRCRAPASGRAAAGRSITPRSIPTPIRRRRDLRRREGEAGGGVLLQGAWRVSAALRRRAHGARSRCGADGILAEHL